MPFFYLRSNRQITYTPPTEQEKIMPRKTHQIKSGIKLNRSQASRFQNTFGISAHTVVNALRGDRAANEHLGKLAVDGKIISDNREVIIDSLEAVIQGTEALTTINEKMITQGNQSVRKIRQSINNAKTSEQQYGHAITEMNLSTRNALRHENKRHQLMGEFQQMRFKVGDAQLETDVQYQLDNLENQLVQKQIDADREYKKRVNQHYLTYGNEARPSLVANKDYGQAGSASNPISVMVENVRNWLTGR
jgi:mRNA-degrading endonuclease YafQ of YafQ-DinJ toxin-antitoxin module